jgi:hypothetical protein
MTIAQDTIVRALDAYCFEEIWNEPLLEYADNVQLIAVSPRFLINWIIGEKYIPLPTNGQQYAVYRVNYSNLGGSLVIPKNTWVSTNTIASQYLTLFHVYNGNGMMLPKSGVFLYYNSYTNTVFVAVQKAPMLSVIGLSEWSSMWMSVYRYLQQPGSVQMTCQSFYVPNPDTGYVVEGQINNAIVDSLAITQPGTTVYVNGYDMPIVNGMVAVTPGSYVDIITDTTVIGKYSVNLTTTTTGYFSTMYNTYKEVLHCPKTLNPNNNIITTELLSLTARRNSDNVGLYISKAETNSVTQITHNDVGINTDVVDAMRNAVGSQDISIEVKIRSHAKTLIREINYIDYLYICDDATILTFLIGAGDASLPFWAAASLEQSAYVGYMTATGTLITSSTMGSFVTGLGYYTVLSVLCQHLNTYPVNSLPMSNISVPKPLVFSGLSAYPMVYLNGIKVKDSQITYSNTNHDKILIGFGSDVYYTTGYNITVDIIEAGINIPTIFTPSSGNSTITLSSETMSIYQLNTLSTPTAGYDVTSSVSCTPIIPASGTAIQTYASSSGTEIVFAPSAYGNTYIIQSGTFSRAFGFDVTTLVNEVAPIHVELTTLCSDNTTVVPFVGYNSLDVYLNGKRLIPNIDYAANPILDGNGNVSIVQLMICNMSFICQGMTNYVEVIARTGSVTEQEIGYMANNMAGMGNSVEFWYTGMSEAFIGGKYQIGATDVGNALEPNPAIGNGVPFNIFTTIPDIVSTVLAGYGPTADNSRIALINAYFNKQPAENNISTLVVPNSWKLYSPYLTAIYYDVTQAGTVELFSNDPDDTLFLAQFASYNYLMANDPTVNGNISLVDLRFCDVNPCYGTVTVPNTNTYTILRRLATLVMTSDPNTLGDVANG